MRGRPKTAPHVDPMPCRAVPSLAVPGRAMPYRAGPSKRSLPLGTDSQVDL